MFLLLPAPLGLSGGGELDASASSSLEEEDMSLGIFICNDICRLLGLHATFLQTRG